jgi:hypothetical protein
MSPNEIKDMSSGLCCADGRPDEEAAELLRALAGLYESVLWQEGRYPNTLKADVTHILRSLEGIKP